MTDSEKLTKPRIEEAPLAGVKLIYPKIFPDHRGFFCETYNIKEWARELNFNPVFLQDNHSYSTKGVTRGMHVQPGMDKLVTCISGEIIDIVVDIRPDSENVGEHFGVRLSGKSAVHLWVPSGFAHGFQCLSESAHVMYKGFSINYVTPLPDEKFLECCQNDERITPGCYHLCNFNRLNKENVILAYVLRKCSVTQGIPVMNCATSYADHTRCCMQNNVHLANYGTCLPFCHSAAGGALMINAYLCLDTLNQSRDHP